MFGLSSLYEKYRDAASCEDHPVNTSIRMYMYILYIYISDLSLFIFKFIWATVEFNPRVILIITDATIVDSGFR